MSDHDPFNNPVLAHENARELMSEKFLWSCTNELAPFGSDEGWDAYYEWRSWRQDYKDMNICYCLNWILSGRIEEYNENLYSDDVIEENIAEPNSAFLAEHYDTFTLDTTIIATVLGQLLDEGKIDLEAKPYALVAINRQSHPKICINDERNNILSAIKRVVESA